MKLKTLVIAGAIMAIAVPVADAAKGGSSADPTSGNTRDSATGGGQAFFDTAAPTSGAGDTVAFQAQRAKGADPGSDDATGQIQVNRRSNPAVDNSEGAVKFHGTIDCLVTNGVKGSGMGDAFISGESRSGIPFELYVNDGGTGQTERDDNIMLFVGDETENNDADENNDTDTTNDKKEVCGFSEYDPTSALELFRGNVQVRNRDNSADNYPDTPDDSGGASALTLLGL